MDWSRLFRRWKKDYDFKTFTNSAVSLLLTVVFALCNGFLGIAHGSPWHGSIGVYYLLLILLRGMILLTEKRAKTEAKAEAERLRRRMFVICSALLLLLNLCLIGPLMLLVKQQRPVHMTLIPAIAMAAYAFDKITLASINLVKRKRSENCLVRLLRSINFIDALLSIMTLQNTLIMVAGKGNRLSGLQLAAVTSGMMWLIIVVLSVSGLIYGVKEERKIRQDPFLS